MVNDYRRGWEDALDVVLTLKDWDAIQELRSRLINERVQSQINGPI